MYGAIALVVVAGLTFAAGPRPSLDDTNIPEPNLPDGLYDVAGWITDREKQVGDLTPGTAARVLWGDGPGRRTPLAFVYLHGFTASRREVTPVAEWTAAKFRANSFYVRFAGHGHLMDADGNESTKIGDATARDWLRDAVEALRIGQRLGERVVLVAASTGASLAIWLAATYPDDVAGLVLISPNFGPRDRRAEWALGPWGRQIANAVSGGKVRFEERNERHRTFWTLEVPVEAVVQMMLTVDLVRRVPLENVHAPVLMFFHPEDHVLDISRTVAAFHRMSNPANRLLDISQTHEPAHRHLLTGSIHAPTTTNWVVEQITEYIREQFNMPQHPAVAPAEAEDEPEATAPAE